MGTQASKHERTHSGRKASRKPSRSQRDPDSPLQFVIACWKSIPGHKLLSKEKLEDLCSETWPASTASAKPELRWPPGGSFNEERLNHLRKALIEEKPRQLEYLATFEAVRGMLQAPKGTTSYQLPILNPGRQPMPPPYEDDDIRQTLVPFYYQGPPPRAPTSSDSSSSSGEETGEDETQDTDNRRVTRLQARKDKGGAKQVKNPEQARTKIPSSTLHNTIENSTQVGNKPTPAEPHGSATGTLGCDKETPGTSDQVSSTVTSTAVQMPLRALPIPPLQPDGPPRMIYTHQPFYTSDLVTWSNQMPSLRDDPDKCHRQVSAIFSTHNPTWPDVHVLLNALFNEAEKADILTKAGEAIELPDYQRGRPQGLQALTAQCLRVEPEWDYNTTDGIWCLNLFKKAILDGVKAAGRRTVNWTKVQSVMQGPNEHPSDYYTRLVSAIKTWGGIDPENPQHEVIVKGFFKDQACPDIRKALNLQIGYDGKSVSEILSIAKSVYNSRDERKKKETKPEVEQILALSMDTAYGPNRGRGLPRGKGIRGGGPPNPYRQWGPGTGGCYYCQEEGHIKRFCPYLNGIPVRPKLSALSLHCHLRTRSVLSK
uniref:CCHC-type domain-containing protein n=1 Tax=Podarcis muralis TaxID=64176 RepID=A0A670K059_PODMU